jgi:hypothetical protein
MHRYEQDVINRDDHQRRNAIIIMCALGLLKYTQSQQNQVKVNVTFILNVSSSLHPSTVNQLNYFF